MGIIKKIIEIEYERYKIHKAMRILSKQEWSVEFLTSLLKKCNDVQITIKNGNKILLLKPLEKEQPEESIFDKLDDEAAIQSFIAAHSTRG